MNHPHPYDNLTPDTILNAVESCGLTPDGRLLALNSYENRVYQIGMEEGSPLVAKFYRPERWEDAAIREEHNFAQELAEREIPVVAPVTHDGDETLREHQGFRFALFPRRGGRWPELEDPEVQYRIGRFLGRIHGVGAVRPFGHRPALDLEGFGVRPCRYLLEEGFLPSELETQYQDLAEALLERIAAIFEEVGALRAIRLHGDFHPGNILWTDGGAHIVDLDDCRTGPAVQDLWMLLSGDRAQMTAQLSELLEGYEEFYAFDRRELRLIEPLRTLRIIHYAYWLALRWQDPAFPHNFPWFNTPRYWEEQVLILREQLESLEHPPLCP